MSLAERADPADVRDRIDGIGQTRAAALVAVAATLATALQVMYHFIDVVGVPAHFLALVALSMIAATVLADRLEPKTGVALGALLFLVGLVWYLQQLSGSTQLGALLLDTLSLLTGKSLLRISNIRSWVLGVTPGPVFLTWYFAMRRRYAIAVTVAGATLGFLVLTGDADLLTTLSGVIAATAALGFGDFDRRGEPIAAAETILVVAALMVIVPSMVSVVPATAGTSVNVGGGGQPSTVEANLLQTGEEMSVQGSIDLSPEVRFTVTSTQPDYWRIKSFSRYTGDGWISTSGTRVYQGGQLQDPRGPSRRVEQTYRAETNADIMPAAWKPISVDAESDVQVSGDGSVEPVGTLAANDTYQVVSKVPDASPRQLNETGRDYPERIENTYTQLPDSTPDRVAERTDRITANARSPYETALTVERWLQNNREYSLDVDRPEGNIADAFLFDMDAGYCTYYATTMVAMLRSQDIPARMAVGYTSGERVARDRWVVRGLDAHAWVEVYFEDYGWIRFDPTPAGPRESTEQESVETARESGFSNVDTNGSGGEEWTPTPTVTPEPLTPNDEAAPGGPVGPATAVDPFGSGPVRGTLTANGTQTGNETSTTTDGGSSSSRSLPTRQETALGLLALVGTVIGIRRSKAGQKAYRAVWLRYQPRDEPAADVERAFQRLQYYLGEQAYRDRRPNETVREYLDAIDADPRAREVAAIRERARYGASVNEATADRAVSLVDEIVR